jgi:hypothetical protein
MNARKGKIEFFSNKIKLLVKRKCIFLIQLNQWNVKFARLLADDL